MADSSTFKDWAKGAFRSAIFDGVLLILFGLFLLLFPDTSLRVLCIIIGVVLMVMAVGEFILAVKTQVTFERMTDIFLGAIELLLGFAILINSNFFISIFQVVIGILLICGGIVMFIRAFDLRNVRGSVFVLAIVLGVLTVILGIIIIANPVAFAGFITQLMGVSLMIEGVSLICLMQSGKKRVKEVAQAVEDAAPIEVEIESAETVSREDVSQGRTNYYGGGSQDNK